MVTPSLIHDDDYRAAIDEASARLRFQVEFAQSALKSLLLVNGGAILALLTLIGNSQAEFDERSIWWAFLWFGFGISAALSAYFGAFLSQYYFLESTAHEAWNAQLRRDGLGELYDVRCSNRRGNFAFLGGLLFAIASLISFVAGSFVALGGIL